MFNLKTQKPYFYVRIVTISDKVGNYPDSASKDTPLTYFQFHKMLNAVVIFIMRQKITSHNNQGYEVSGSLIFI